MREIKIKDHLFKLRPNQFGTNLLLAHFSVVMGLFSKSLYLRSS